MTEERERTVHGSCSSFYTRAFHLRQRCICETEKHAGEEAAQETVEPKIRDP